MNYSEFQNNVKRYFPELAGETMPQIALHIGYTVWPHDNFINIWLALVDFGLAQPKQRAKPRLTMREELEDKWKVTLDALSHDKTGIDFKTSAFEEERVINGTQTDRIAGIDFDTGFITTRLKP